VELPLNSVITFNKIDKSSKYKHRHQQPDMEHASRTLYSAADEGGWQQTIVVVLAAIPFEVPTISPLRPFQAWREGDKNKEKVSGPGLRCVVVRI
jgi:hypothetical protein